MSQNCCTFVEYVIKKILRLIANICIKCILILKCDLYESRLIVQKLVHTIGINPCLNFLSASCAVLCSLTIRAKLAGVNPRTTKLFLSTFAPKGGCINPPGFWSSRPNFLVKFFMGIVSGSRNRMVIVRIFYLYFVTLKLKVIDFVHGYGATP